MEKANDLLTSVNEGVSLLIQRCTQLKQDKKNLEVAVEELRNQLNIKEKACQELDEKYRVLKMEQASESKKDTPAMKNRIEDMVREVDKCISLLQK